MSAKTTLKWLIFNFSIISVFKVLIYYMKKKLNLLDNKKEFLVKFKFMKKTIKFRLRENKDDFAILREIFLHQVYDIPHQKVSGNILDLGAHIGTSAVFFSKVYPTSKIWCCEPDPESRKILLFNLGINKVNANVLNLAISDKKDFKKFSINKDNPAYSKMDNKGSLVVQTQTLDNLIEGLNLPKVDLIKMDIEGEEIAALDGLKKRSADIKMFICETHYNEYPIKKLIKSFESKGFDVQKPLEHWKELNNKIEYPIMIALNKFGGCRNEKKNT